MDADPLNPQSLIFYSYVQSEPLSNSDPSGLKCQHSDDGVPSDDGDGTGCVEAGINLDGSEITKTVQATVNANGFVDQLQQAQDQQTMMQDQVLVAQRPAQPPQGARDFINYVAANTAGFPTICTASASIRGQIPFIPLLKGGGTVDLDGNVSGSLVQLRLAVSRVTVLRDFQLVSMVGRTQMMVPSS